MRGVADCAGNCDLAFLACSVMSSVHNYWPNHEEVRDGSALYCGPLLRVIPASFMVNASPMRRLL